MANNLDYDARGDLRTRQLPVQPGAVWKKGDFLIWTLTGLTGPPAVGVNYGAGGFTGVNRIAGRALADSTDPNTGLAYTSAQIEIAEPGTQWPVVIYHGTPASAVPTLAQLGTAYEFRNMSGPGGLGLPAVDVSATTNVACRIMDFVRTTRGLTDIPNWPDNVTGGAQFSLAFVEFLGAACQFTGAR